MRGKLPLLPVLLVLLFVAAPAGVRGAEERWLFSPGGSPLETFYNTQARDAWPPAPDLLKIIETEEKAGRYYEAWLWAGAITRLQPQQREAPRRTLDRLLEPLASWEIRLGITRPAADWRDRARDVADRVKMQPLPRGAQAAPRPATTLSPADQMRLAEILLLAAIERVDETRAAQWLRFQYQIDPTRERFLRWRAFVIHNQRLGELLEFHRAARQAPEGDPAADFPEILEDEIIVRLRRLEYAQAFDPLLDFLKRHPERARRLSGALRLAFRARLAELCEQGRYSEAMDHIALSRSIPYNVLDYDMAVHAIYRHLLLQQREDPNADRQALLKFLMNHAVFNQASLVAEALAGQLAPGDLPQTSRALIEARQGNPGVAYQLLHQATLSEPPTPLFFFALGYLTETHKHLWELAAVNYRAALRLDPEYEPAHLALARHEIHTGRMDEALSRCSLVLAHHPENTLALYESGRAFYLRGDLARARERFEALARSDRATPDHFYYLAAIALRENAPERARETLAALLGEFEEDPQAYLMLAGAARQAGDPGAEIAALEKVCQITGPWRFDRIASLRLFNAAAARLLEHGVTHACAPRVKMLSKKKRDREAILPSARQPPGPWSPEPRLDKVEVHTPSVTGWAPLSRRWREGWRGGATVWRQLPGRDGSADTCNRLELINPSPYEMLGIRVFADSQEFAFVYRLAPGQSMMIEFRSDVFPANIGLVYTSDLGVEFWVAPEADLHRRHHPRPEE